jgi:hypothetical protein
LYEGKSKSKVAFEKKQIYCIYIETELILLFNVNPLDFKAPVPALHKFFNSIRKKFFLVASLTCFEPLQFLERIVTADEIWVHHNELESKTQSVAWKRPTSPVAKKFKKSTISQ